MTKLLDGEPLKVEDLDLSGMKVIYYVVAPTPALGMSFRSCWNCNPAHKHLKSYAHLCCFICGKTYRHGIEE